MIKVLLLKQSYLSTGYLSQQMRRANSDVAHNTDESEKVDERGTKNDTLGYRLSQ